MRWFNKKESEQETKTEQDFQTIVNIVKYLDKTEFKKFMEATQLVWDGYDKLLRVKTRDEKETKPVDEVADFIETGGK